MRPVFRRRMIRATIGGAAAVSLASAGALGMTQAFASPASVHAVQSQLSVTSEFMGTAPEPYNHNAPTNVYRYTLTNANDMSVQILTLGATVQDIFTPGKSGHTANVVLGFKGATNQETVNDYVNLDSPATGGGTYFGETIGRYGNRIAGGKFTLDGKLYSLPLNNNGNTLHGGLNGFGNHIWSAMPVSGAGYVGVQLKLVSPDGDEGSAFEPSCPTCTGFPGKLTVFVTYTLDNSGSLKIHYTATTTKATVINLTNHSYFNLAGESTLSAMDQKVYMNADRITTVDKLLIPDGKFASVFGTPFDFTNPHGTAIGARINDGNNQQLLFGPGYDHNWVINKSGPKLDGLLLDARATDPASGRELTVWSSEPGVQFYAGNFLTGTLVGYGGHTYRQGAGYTFETQHFPDSPNHLNFPSTELDPNQTYDTTTIFQFSS
jgi:aldose 1-epimerase